MPATMPPAIPASGEPVACATAAAVNAPNKSFASIARSTTPERSVYAPPIAASTYGTAIRSTCARNASDSTPAIIGILARARGAGGGYAVARSSRVPPVHVWPRDRDREHDHALQDLGDLLRNLVANG